MAYKESNSPRDKMAMGEPELKIQVLPDDTEMFRSEYAAKRMTNIVASAAEQELYRFNPNAARRNDNPGIPDEDYGEIIQGT